MLSVYERIKLGALSPTLHSAGYIARKLVFVKSRLTVQLTSLASDNSYAADYDVSTTISSEYQGTGTHKESIKTTIKEVTNFKLYILMALSRNYMKAKDKKNKVV
jgi:hypothetical protein